ncbi:MAG: class I SAM-dependent methyltransferase [Bacteroidales bacterium]|jgi:hypothetical protein
MDLKETKRFNYHASERHPWETARFEVICEILKQKFPEILKQKLKILDVGCGDIFFIENLSKHFPLSEFYAVDTAFDEKILKELRNKFTDKPIFIENSLNNIELKKNHFFDFVLLLDVIEHIEDDIGFLTDLKNNIYINNNTYFIITAPAFNFLFSSHDVFLGHYRRYSNKTLYKSITQSGFETISSGYFFFSILISRLFKKVIERFFNVKKENQKEGIGNWNGNKILTLIIKKYLLFDFRISNCFRKIGIKIPGLTNYVICKKSV